MTTTREDRALARVNYGDVRELLAVTPWDRGQIELVKRQIMPGASDGELAMFGQVCKQLRLDPFARDVYAIKVFVPGTGEVYRAHVAIEGWRKLAAATGKYRGEDGPVWCGDDGVWRDVWLGEAPPAAARVGVYHADFPAPLYAVATYTEFCRRTKEGRPLQTWGSMPAHMLAIRAESHALRRAFPDVFGGIELRDGSEALPRPVVSTATVADLYPAEETPTTAAAVEGSAERTYDLPCDRKTAGGRVYYQAEERCPLHDKPWVREDGEPFDAWRHATGKGEPPCFRQDVMGGDPLDPSETADEAE